MRPILVTIFILSVPLCAFAQMSSVSDLVAARRSGDPSPNTPEWQLTLDVIRQKTMLLMEENSRLVNEYNLLLKSYKVSEMDKKDLILKNETIREFLKERHGRSDQQIRIEELTGQTRLKEEETRSLHKNLLDLQKESQETQRRLALRKLKLSEVQLHVKAAASQDKAINVIDQRAALENDKEFDDLKLKLQQQKDDEEGLQKQLEQLKKKSMESLVATPQEAASEIKALEDKAAGLRKQKEDLQNRSNVDNNQRYLQLMAKKKELEEKVRESEEQLSQLKEPATFGLLDPRQKKQIIRQMAQVDSRNIQLRQKISDMHQDISVLREQVKRLERKVRGVPSLEEDKK